MNYKAVIFDMDGTILDTLDDLMSSVNHALKLHGLPERSREEIRQFLGNGMVKLIERSVPEGTDEDTVLSVLDAHKKYYPLHCAEKTKPYPGIPGLLSDLKNAGIMTAVVSNKTDKNVKTLVDDYFNGLFTVSVGAREGVPRKPSPEMIEIALSELGCSKEETVYIGDSDIDIKTAQNSGLKMITVLWGFRDKDQLISAGAEIFAKDCNELKDLLFSMI